MRDILALTSDVARAIAGEIKVTLTPQEQMRLASARPVNPEAYELYLKGVYYSNRRTEEGLERGIQYFKEAVAKDPNYAVAYSALAHSYNNLADYSILSPQEAIPKARAAASTALELDDNLAEAHAAIGMSNLAFQDWPGAERQLRRALELNPGYARAHHLLAMWLWGQGRVDQALAEIRRARELDPLSPLVNTNVGMALYLARQYDQAIEQQKRTLELDPNFIPAHWPLGLAYEQKGILAEAIAEFQKAASPERNRLYLASLGHAYAVAGRRAEARKVLGELTELSKQAYIPAYEIAVLYTGLGENDHAFATLQRACDEHSGRLFLLKVDPRLDPLRSDPRFQDLLRRLNFPDQEKL
jgi:Flp pilus assembly protein TadD